MTQPGSGCGASREERTGATPCRAVAHLAGRIAWTGLLAFAACGHVQADVAYPTRPVHVIVTFAAGGPGDILARAISEPLSKALGQPVIVENRAGADGATGAEQAARAAPDGYTMLQIASTQTINMVLKRETIRYDLERDFTPVARLAQASMVLVVPASSTVRSVDDLVAAAKSKREGLVYGSGAAGSVGHLSAEMFKQATGIRGLHVPYKGTGAAMPDLISGRLDFFFITQLESVGAVQGGTVRALAVTAPQRVAALPLVPTMVELGFKGFDAKVTYGYVVPRKTPPEVVARLQAAIMQAMAAPSVQTAFRNLAVTPYGGGPQEMRATIQHETATWGAVIKAAGITAD